MNTSERILQLEKELTELKAQERREREEARKKEIEERDKELKVILDAIVVFNDKHNTDCNDNNAICNSRLHPLRHGA